MALVECLCMHMPHRLGRPSGVDHTNKGKWSMNSDSTMSHAPLILQHYASILPVENSFVTKGVILRSLEGTNLENTGSEQKTPAHIP